MNDKSMPQIMLFAAGIVLGLFSNHFFDPFTTNLIYTMFAHAILLSVIKDLKKVFEDLTIFNALMGFVYNREVAESTTSNKPRPKLPELGELPQDFAHIYLSIVCAITLYCL